MWKTWNFKKTFFSQGKVREIGNFGQFLGKVREICEFVLFAKCLFFSIGQIFQGFCSMSGTGLSVTTFPLCGESHFSMERLRNGPMLLPNLSATLDISQKGTEVPVHQKDKEGKWV